MSVLGSAAPDELAHRGWRFGVRARLLLALFAIAGFAVVAAGAGLYAFREVGGRLQVVDARILPTLSALELSRAAERIIAAAPMLLAATDRTRRDDASTQLAAEVARLNGYLLELRREESPTLPLATIEASAAVLTTDLRALEELVARRLATREVIAELRLGVFRTRYQLQRLLAPWLEVIEGEIAARVADREAASPSPGEAPRTLASLIELQELLRSVQAQGSAVADILVEASTTDQPRRLEILLFQLSLALHDLEEGASGFDPKLYPLLLEQAARLREFSRGPDSIAETRQQELALVDEGTDLLAAIGQSSAQLLAAVDQLGSAAKLDIGEAIDAALSVQQLSSRALIIVVVLSLLTSSLIVWLYVGRNIVRRLTVLSDSMLAIAAGSLDTPAAVEGTDEIAAMGRAVEVFRRNTLERDCFANANKYKSRFIAAASHDLRQPLHALNLFVAQLRSEPDSAERSRLAGRIEEAAASMNELFESLLDMSKLDAGALQPDVSDYPVQPLLTRIETNFAGAAREKGLRLRIMPSEAWFRSDFILLERVLLNLVSNAVRYTERGGVAVGCRRRGDHLRIDVWDTGPGIPEERQRIIFDEFVQLDGQTLNRSGGLGLGLSIVERLGRLLGHPIEVRSWPERGSRFSVIVPRAAARAEATAGNAATFQTILEPLRGKRILVVDDDPLVLDGMSGMLRSWGCDVAGARSEEAAVALMTMQAREPDLIISDLRLGGGRSGIEAIERLRSKLNTETPAFLISGDTAPEALQEARAGGYHLLHKPVAPMRLRAMLNQLVRTRVSPERGARSRRPPSRRSVSPQGPTPQPR